MTNHDHTTLLQSASHALRSYQFGNSAPHLAEKMANDIDAALTAPQPQKAFETQPLRRDIETWRNSNPALMSRQSQGTLFYALFDARSDILTLAAGRPEAPFTDDAFIEGYKVGTKFCSTVAEANRAIERSDGVHWIPLYRKKHPAPQQQDTGALTVFEQRNAVRQAIHGLKYGTLHEDELIVAKLREAGYAVVRIAATAKGPNA